MQTLSIGRVVHSFVKYLYRFMMTKENKYMGITRNRGGPKINVYIRAVTLYQRTTLLGKYSSMSSM